MLETGADGAARERYKAFPPQLLPLPFFVSTTSGTSATINVWASSSSLPADGYTAQTFTHGHEHVVVQVDHVIAPTRAKVDQPDGDTACAAHRHPSSSPVAQMLAQGGAGGCAGAAIWMTDRAAGNTGPAEPCGYARQ